MDADRAAGVLNSYAPIHPSQRSGTGQPTSQTVSNAFTTAAPDNHDQNHDSHSNRGGHVGGPQGKQASLVDPLGKSEFTADCGLKAEMGDSETPSTADAVVLPANRPKPAEDCQTQSSKEQISRQEQESSQGQASIQEQASSQGQASIQEQASSQGQISRQQSSQEQTSSHEEAFLLRSMLFQERSVRILLQNRNGPCPLLAICNALALRGELPLPATENHVSAARLLAMVGERLVDRAMHSSASPPSPPPMESSHEAPAIPIESCMDIMPQLLTGLVLNLNHLHVLRFDLSPARQLFQLLDIPLVHGWVLDPQSEATYLGLVSATDGQPTFNALQDCIVRGQQAESQLVALPTTRRPSTERAIEVASCAAVSKSDSSSMAVEVSSSSSESVSPAHLEQWHRAVADGILCQQFLHDTSSQLTYYGLQQLGETMAEGVPHVLFRNNHFQVLLKYRPDPDLMHYQLMTLVTDIGYQNTDVIWETLSNTEGDSTFLNSQFQVLRMPKTLAPSSAEVMYQGFLLSESKMENAVQSVQETARSVYQSVFESTTHASHAAVPVGADGIVSNNEFDPDFRLAWQLQQEEVEKQRRSRQERRSSADDDGSRESMDTGNRSTSDRVKNGMQDIVSRCQIS